MALRPGVASRIQFRLVNPHGAHDRLAARWNGAKTARDVDEDVRVETDQARILTDRRFRVTGSLVDGTAFRSLLEGLERDGHLVDETEVDPEDLPPVYENNGLIHFRGAVPTRTNGAAAQIGTGGDVTFADATDAAGRLVIVTGTGALASGVLATITFAVPRQNADYGVAIWAADSDAAGTAGRGIHSDFGGRTTTTWTLNAASALAASTSYHVEYWVHDRTQL